MTPEFDLFVAAGKVFGDAIRVEVTDRDRHVGRIFLGERFINMEMVRDGFASRYVAIRQAGRVHRRGERSARSSARVVG